MDSLIYSSHKDNLLSQPIAAANDPNMKSVAILAIAHATTKIILS
jgi:hypothetical protein